MLIIKRSGQAAVRAVSHTRTKTDCGPGIVPPLKSSDGCSGRSIGPTTREFDQCIAAAKEAVRDSREIIDRVCAPDSPDARWLEAVDEIIDQSKVAVRRAADTLQKR